ncbi:MAG: capsule assembly Wzi family protein [Gemmatimonadaceae bacterium]
MPIYFNRVTGNTMRALLAAAIALLAVPCASDAQTESSIAGVRGGVVAGGELDNYLRYLQTTGQVPLAAWGLRPFSASEVDALSKASGPHPWKGSWLFRTDSAHHFSVLPVTASAGYNSAFPWGSNDGAVWAGRGLTTSLQGGFAVAWGPASLVVNPIVFRAENTAFTLQPNGESGDGVFRNGDFPNDVDLPQRFGNSAYSKFDWGQSTLRVDGLGMTVGFSTANQYWGPATVFPVILGNNAAGVPHAFFGTERPTNIGIGRIQARVVYGMERQSDYSPVAGPDTFTTVDQPGTRRFMSGLVVTFSPKPIPGLELGAARYFHQAWDGQIDSRELRSPFEGILKSSISRGLAIPGIDDKDVLKNQLASVFGRWVLARSGFELYAEYGHEDHNADVRDLELEPDHSRIAMAGFRKVFAQRNGSFSALRAEYIDASAPSLGRHRDEGGVYIHTVLRQGHTEGGQLLGAPIGAGSFGAEIIVWERYTRDGRNSWYVERTSQDNATSFFANGMPDDGASDLTGSIGYERYRVRQVADITYGIAATAAKRAATLPRELNLTFHVQITPHRW